MKVALISPPVSSPFSPPLALPSLTAYLRAAGIDVLQIDASIEGLHTRLKPSADEHALRAAFGDTEGERLSARLRAVWREDGFAFEPGAFDAAVADLKKIVNLLLCSEREPFVGYFRHELAPAVAAFGPDLVGLSLLSSDQLSHAISLARELAQAGVTAPIVMGGTAVTQVVDQLLHENGWSRRESNTVRVIQPNTHAGLLAWLAWPWVIPGEGEEALLELCRRIQQGGSTVDLPSLVTRNFRERSLTLNPWAKPLPGTSLPLPDLVGLPLRKYVTPIVVAPASTSRGCYWNRCTFCDDAGRLEQRYRRVPVATLLRTFRTYQDLGVQAVLLCDECISPATLAGLAASMPGAGIHLSWFVLARFERALLPLIGTAAAAGLRLLAFGLESGSPRIVKLMDKGYDHSTAQAIIDECARHGVGVQLNTIIGYPGETIEDAVDTVDFLERNADKVASIRVTRWYLGVNSIMGRNPERYGVTPLGDRPLSRDPATFRLGPGLTRSQVDALVEVLRAHASFGEKVITEDSGFLVEDYEFARMILSDQARGVQRNQIPPNLPQDGRSVTAEG